MEGVAGTSASSNDSSNTPKETNKAEMTNKEIREEYFNQLRLWLATVNSYQMYYNKFQQDMIRKHYQQVTSNPTEVPRVIPNVVPEAQTSEPSQFVGIKCKIPSLWKRFGAELIDFIILGFIKLVIAYFVVDSIIEIDLAKYNSIFLQDDFSVDYTTAVEMTSELIFLEITHRIIVCFYEVYWLQGSTSFEGGATIGKIMLDLTVVRADKLFQIRGQPNDVIALTPGGSLGWRRAILRSISKNLLFAFFFPLPFVTAAANQNRCQYDVLCNSMVVELVQPLRCEQSELIPIE